MCIHIYHHLYMCFLAQHFVYLAVFYTPGSTTIADTWKMDPLNEDIFPIKNRDVIPASYVIVYQKLPALIRRSTKAPLLIGSSHGPWMPCTTWEPNSWNPSSSWDHRICLSTENVTVFGSQVDGGKRPKNDRFP